jgi:hypothetical protein
MTLRGTVKGAALALGLIVGAAIPAEAGLFIGVGPVAVGVGRSRYLYGPPYGVPAYGPAYYAPAYAPPAYGPAYAPYPYYPVSYYGESSETYYSPYPTGYYMPPARTYPPYGMPTYAPTPAAAVYPYAYPYRKVEVEYDRHGGYEVEFKR